MSFHTLNDYITIKSKISVYTLNFLSPDDIDKMKMIAETEIWNMMKGDDLWVKNAQKCTKIAQEFLLV